MLSKTLTLKMILESPKKRNPDEYPDMIKTEYEVSLFPMRRGLHSPFEISPENNDLLVIEGCKEEETQQESALPSQSEVHDGSPKGTCTISNERKRTYSG